MRAGAGADAGARGGVAPHPAEAGEPDADGPPPDRPPWADMDEAEVRHRMKAYHQQHHAPYFENAFGGDPGETGEGSSSQVNCGRKPVFGQDVDLYEDSEDGSLFVRGLERCDSIWSCATCARKIAGRRGEELEAMIQSWTDHGGTVEHMALTLRHHQGQDEDFLLDALQAAWGDVRSKVLRGRVGEEYDVVHYLQATEMTVGPNGPHPHKHVILFVGGDWSEEDRQNVEDAVFSAWRRRLARIRGWSEDGGLRYVPHDRDPRRFETLLDDPDREKAVQIDGAGDGAGYYVAKMGLAREVARFDEKEGQGENRTGFEILRDAAFLNDPRDDHLWRRYVEAMHGRAHWHKSKGMDEDPRTQKYQEELDLERGDTRRATVGQSVWNAIRGTVVDALDMAADLLAAYREEGWTGVVRQIEVWLDDLPPDKVVSLNLVVDDSEREIYSRTGRPARIASAEGV